VLDLESIVGPVIGSFFGVWLGFLVNNYANKRKRTRLRKEYTKGLKSEIQQAIGLLENRLLQLLPEDLWKSLVNSGDLALFPFTQREDLPQAYFAIGKCNYEAVRARDLGELSRAEGDYKKRDALDKAWQSTTEEAFRLTDSTLKYLQGLATRSWWTEV
jgi:hypothetical protein